ncbi:hypothetical protein H2200_008673 [Cladophialophora chaetospira]|uniref:NmrA-like domain-containing protein n=1 Tax=Cladophialophora chaetospira TaxID=386627 RepID=A0AA38X4V5_9EURO|nr:hypothetical protein H2200_008673 [Cladophialophora chaetospira]
MAAEPVQTRVAVVGLTLMKPNGNLGKYVIPALAASGFEITVVTREPEKAQELVRSLSGSKAISSDAPIFVVKGDYTTPESLTPTLAGHDSVISLLNRDQTAAQMLVIDATILAGVKHIIPAAFGIDSRNSEVRALPHLAIGYIKSEEHLLKAIADTNGRTSFTIIHNGGFLEWLLQYDLYINLSGQGDEPSMVFDDGNIKVSVSSMVDIGKAVATAVTHRHDERFRDQFLLMHNLAISQNEMLGIAKKILPDKPWPVVKVDTIEAEKKSQEIFDASVASGEKAPASAYHGFFARAFFGKGLGYFPQVDNELLGVKERDVVWLKSLVERYLIV